MKTIEGKPVGNARIAIVASRYNSQIVERLLAGCTRVLTAAGVDESGVTLVHVPGAFEIPVAAGRLAGTGRVDVIITLGAVIRGETSHFDYIAGECARGISTVALESGVPVIFGVLTVENAQQALDRSGDDESNKGSEAARSALEMVSVLRQIG